MGANVLPIDGWLGRLKSVIAMTKEIVVALNSVVLLAIFVAFFLKPQWIVSPIKQMLDTILASMKAADATQMGLKVGDNSLTISRTVFQNVGAQQNTAITSATTQLQTLQSTVASALETLKSGKALTPAELKQLERSSQSTATVLAQANDAKQKFQAVMAPPVSPAQTSDRYGVVIGGSSDLGIVRHQIGRAKDAGFSDVQIYKIGDVYNNVIVGPTLADSKAMLARAKVIDAYAKGDYLINLTKWCPAPQPTATGENICR
jgi:hypothetical protein